MLTFLCGFIDPVSGDPLQPSIVSSSGATGRHQFESVALASELRQQIDALASQRSHLEQQLAWVSRENDRLSGELAASNRRAAELQTQLEDNQVYKYFNDSFFSTRVLSKFKLKGTST